MDTFRPPFPASAPHQLCPVCMVPHFPFCPSHNASLGHPQQQYETFYAGQQTPQTHHGAFNLHTLGRASHNLMERHSQSGRPSEFHPHQSYFPQGYPNHFVDDRGDKFSYGQVQSAVHPFSLPDQRNHSSSGSMYADRRLGGRNARSEPDRNFVYQQQQSYAEFGERVERKEPFLPIPHTAELPRLDSNTYMQENRIEKGPRGEHYLNHGFARIEKNMAKHHYGMDSYTGAVQGRSEYEPFDDASVDHMNANNPPSLHDAAQVSCDNRGTQLFAANRQQMTAPGIYKILGDEKEHYQSSCMQGRGEVALTDQNRSTQQGLKREGDLALLNGFHTETHEHREEAQLRDMGHSQTSKGMKRKHGQQPLSREEELLIEKGLLDDELYGTQSNEFLAHQAHHGSEQLMPMHKQGFPCQQSSYPSSATIPEKETTSTKFAGSGESKCEGMQYLKSENMRNNRQDIQMERGSPKFAGECPSQSFLPRKRPLDAAVDSRHPSHLIGQNHHFDSAQTNKDILYRQYLEWEAEEKHVEALRRAERLAKEIQQREEGKGMYQPSSLQPTDSSKQESVQDNRLQAYQEHQEKTRVESLELMAGQLQHVYQSHGVSVQRPHENSRFHCDIASSFQEANHESQALQRHARNELVQDTQFVEPYVGMQKLHRESLEQLPVRSSLQPHWSEEQTLQQPHFGLQSLPRHDQLLPMHLLHRRSTAEELYQEKPERAPSHSFHNQLRSDTTHESSESFQSLLGSESIKPPPPDSPPPPLPSAHPSENEGLPPPRSAGTYLSGRQTSLLDTMEYAQQRCPPDSQGLQEFNGLMLSAHNPPQFQPQLPQCIEKSKLVDAVNIFRNPGRSARPDRFVVILRGLPGSGKSYLAKGLRDVEVMNGGSAPRIHSMDDYFTCEVEKEEEIEGGSSRSKKKAVKRVMEYCYEPDMEEAYRASMLKAFKKTLEEGMFKFVIVDDRNVLIADFAQFWAIAKRSGYEAFILEAPYSDVKGCAARNVHNFTEQQIQSMAEHWETTPWLYLKMDVSSLFRADDLDDQDIIEVDMDADDLERDLEEEEEENDQSVRDHFLLLDSERPVSGERWQFTAEIEMKTATASKLRRAPLDVVGTGSGSPTRSSDNALSGLMTTYGKKDKFVHWSDNQGLKGRPIGFSIGSSQKMTSLVIGPGPGYNGASNLPVLGNLSVSENTKTRKNTKLVEQLRAEQEAFKAVFAKRRQRILGMDDEDDD